MALDAHSQGEAEVKGLFVGQAELVCELVDADLLRQRLLLPFIHVVGADTHIRPLFSHITRPSPPSPVPRSPPVRIAEQSVAAPLGCPPLDFETPDRTLSSSPPAPGPPANLDTARLLARLARAPRRGSRHRNVPPGSAGRLGWRA